MEASVAGDTVERGSGHVLLHVCCAPCATYPVLYLRELGYEVTALWYNPNIQPWSEHEARRVCLANYAQQVGMRVLWEPGYEVLAFLRSVVGSEEKARRCPVCYRLRLERAARRAAEGGFAAFTTTLLVSPYQDVAELCRCGEELARIYSVRFLALDFRKGWATRGKLVREYGLYRQQYCGCLFSEFERYAKLPIEQAVAVRYEDK